MSEPSKSPGRSDKCTPNASEPATCEGSEALAGSVDVLAEVPAWAEAGSPRWTIEADAFLARGTHPVEEVLDKAGRLGPGDVLRIRSAFLPAPLIARLGDRGFRTALVSIEGCFETYVTSPT